MDRQKEIHDQVRDAVEAQSPLAIRGGNSKQFYGHPATGQPLDLSGHHGIVDYDPGELVVTCRAGTRLSDLRALLAENGQHLPFEPPGYGAKATVGGTVACGFSGPARPWAGSLRDYLLGVKVINGHGKVLRFGGQVMKNVAGYDISRLMAGALGTLGVLLEVSFKVLPKPAMELTLAFHCDQEEALGRMGEWSGQPLPLSGACWHDGTLNVRLSGAASEVERAAGAMDPDSISGETESWLNLGEHRGPFFEAASKLWRLSVPATAGPIDLDGDCLVDWGGAQRWYSTSESAERIRNDAEQAGGHATLFRGACEAPHFHPLPPALGQLQRRIRQAFDPHGLFAPDRLGEGAG